MGDYEKLNVWKKSHALTCDVYRITTMLTSRQFWSLGDQMRRAVLSIGTNIVEGCGRNHPGHFRNSLTVSLGEANELHYLFLVARDVEALEADSAVRLRSRTDEVRRMLSGLLQSVRQRGRPEQ
jgi:four helix bundle protein